MQLERRGHRCRHRGTPHTPRFWVALKRASPRLGTFNGLVLAARAALDAGARTVLILDLDAHCGGGTHELIHGNERIWQMDVSVNAFDRYEPLGNNQLEMVYDGSRYLPTIERKLTWLEREAPRFDICLYNAGMDPFWGCEIGGMQGVTQKVLRDREAAVFSWCRMRNVPSAFVLAGGYLGQQLERAGSSRSTGSLSKRRAHARDAPSLALSDLKHERWPPSPVMGALSVNMAFDQLSRGC
jgi:acetoin utilization deacetylase AcuC-like enzyme